MDLKPVSELRRVAVCIGVNFYENLPRLRYAVGDAQEVARQLASPAVGQFDRVELMTDFDGRDRGGLAGEEVKAVTRDRIEEALDRLFKGVDCYHEDTLLLVYFAGHATRDDNGNLVLMGSDARRRENGSVVHTSGVSFTGLEGYLAGCEARKIVILVDACHSGAGGQLTARLKLQDGQNLCVIGAAQSDQEAAGSGRYRHGVFTYCLLRAFNQQPGRDGWVTMERVQSVVAESLRELRRGDQEIQFSSQGSRSIGLVKNPLYEQESSEFREQVERVLELRDYEIVREGEADTSRPPSFFRAEKRDGFELSIYGVYCLDNALMDSPAEVMAKALNYLDGLIDNRETSHGMLVTRRPVDQGVVPPKGIIIRTSDELLRDLIDFRNYRREVITEYETGRNERGDQERQGSPPLARVYVGVRGEERISEKKSKSEEKIGWSGDLEQRVREWLAEEDGSRLVLIGEYGTGKSTFCRHLSASLLKEYEAAKDKTGRRIPILLHLRKFTHIEPRINLFLVSHLSEYYGVRSASYRPLEAMAEAGLLFFIFDGFDEMASRADRTQIERNIREIERLAGLKNNKVLLTTRPEYFIDSNEDVEILQRYQRLYLRLLEDEQVDEYLKKYVPFIEKDKPAKEQLSWERYRAKLKVVRDLSDLKRRAVLLEMIIKTLPELMRDDSEVNSATLYEKYLRGEIQRQEIDKKRDLLIPWNDRQKMMEELALSLQLKGENEVRIDQAAELVKKSLRKDQRGELEAHQREFLSCSFLLRSGGNYYFSHRSFQEYLVASRLKSEIERRYDQSFRAVMFSKEIVAFLAELGLSLEVLRRWLEVKGSERQPGKVINRLRNSLRVICRMLEIDPESVEYGKRGEIGRLLAEGEQVLDRIKLLDEFGTNADWYGVLGEVLRLTAGHKQHRQVLAEFEQAIRLNPDKAWFYGCRGQYYRDRGEYKKAGEDFEKGLSLDGGLAWIWGEKGLMCRLMGENRQALENFNRAIRLDEKFAWAYVQRAAVYRRLSEFSKAKRDLEEAKKLDSGYASRGFGLEIGYLSDEEDRVFEGSFSVTMELGFKGTEVSFSEDSSNQESRTIIREMKVGSGQEAVKHGNEEDEHKLIELNKLLEQYSDSVQSYIERGQIYRKRKEYQSALNDFNKAVDLAPEFAAGYMQRAETYREQKEYQLALNDLDTAIKLNSQDAEVYAFRGRIYRLLEKYDLAMNDCERAIELKSDLALAYDQRGAICIETKDFDKALENFGKAIGMDSKYATAYARRGWTYRLMKRYDEALINFARAIELDPKDDWIFSLRGSTYQIMRRYEEALSDFGKAIELDPKDSWAYAQQGETYRLMERYEEALAEYDKAIELDPKYVWAYAKRGEIYYVKGNYEEALAEYDKAIELDPNYIWAYGIRGLVHKTRKEYEKALAEFNKAIELDRQFTGAYVERGEIYRLMERYEEALAEYDKAIELNPKSASGYHKRGEIYRLMERYEEALAEYDKAIELDSKYVWAYAQRGKTCLLLKRYEDALAALDKAIELDFKYAWAYAQRGETYRLLKRYDEAITDLDKAIELDPKYEWAYRVRGQTHREKKEYEKSLADFNKAIDLEPNLAWSYAGRGETYRLLKRYGEALADLDKAIELDPKYEWAYGSRGQTYQARKEYEKSLADFNVTIELDPKYAWAYAKRGEIYLCMRDLVKGKEGFNRALEIKPDIVWYAWALEWLKWVESRPEEDAAQRLRIISAKEPEDYDAIVCTGLALWLEGESEKGLAEVERAINSKPEDWDGYFWKGMMLAKSEGREADAVEAIEKSLAEGLPPIMVGPLRWLETDTPEFYEKYARKWLREAGLL